MVAQAQDTYTPAIPASGETPRALTPQERGRLGGQATFTRYGRAHLYVLFVIHPIAARPTRWRDVAQGWEAID